ncbi:MAG: putative bicarbonate transporter, IctB family [Cyanobacterium sp. T60_A2020_053]|nr:putative bicarbonate transporter, IctB family [Cyanobacterium sp. T60_A2020_053]
MNVKIKTNSLLRWRQTSFIGNTIGLFNSWYDSSYLLAYSAPFAVILTCILLIMTPFSSTSALGVVLMAGAGLWLILTVAEIKPNQITAIHLWIFAYWLASIIATAFSPLKSASMMGLIKFTLYLTFFALTARILGNKRYLNWITSTFLLVSLLVSSYGIRQQIIGVDALATWTDTNSATADVTRVYSYLGNPNLLGGYLLPAVALSVGALITWRSIPQKILALVMLVTNITCIYFTGSRGAWLGLIMAFFVIFLGLNFWWNSYLSPFWRKWLLPILFGLFLLFFAMAFIVVEPLRERFLSIFSWRGDSSNNFRINVWIAVLQMLKDHPIFGIGIGNQVFNQIYPLYMKTNFTALSAYSIFLEIPLESGIIGFTCFLGVLGSIYHRYIQQIQLLKQADKIRGIWIIVGLGALVGLATQGLFDTVWFRPQINTIWWLLVGLIASTPWSKTDN